MIQSAHFVPFGYIWFLWHSLCFGNRGVPTVQWVNYVLQASTPSMSTRCRRCARKFNINSSKRHATSTRYEPGHTGIGILCVNPKFHPVLAGLNLGFTWNVSAPGRTDLCTFPISYCVGILCQMELSQRKMCPVSQIFWISPQNQEYCIHRPVYYRVSQFPPL